MKDNKITFTLLVVYIIVLTWIILFKMSVDFSDLPNIRSINIIPFAESVVTNGRINFTEILDNFLAFIPLGIYIGMLFREKSFTDKALPILCLTFFYEVCQYIFHIGASDITDIIMNFLGGILGIIIINIIYKIFKNEKKVDSILNIFASICTTLLIGLILVLILVN